ncbi:calcium/sodium antiporter [Actinomycetospora soli]|uniref:calcium/sodium antiporter n=1 Tax=Actinomycetospora soli TaxID=2893887 RepID=UPI001E5CFAB1|nr:calcium/sodium antiporter [Actinomycetospora soli]MCD2190877.1 calcium/sodium antiporter [Actinomycetospora soli]
MTAVVLALGGLVLLLGGAELLVRSGTTLAGRLGLSPTVIGLTVVSVGTSLPELAIGIGAARSGNGDLAAGNIVGTNLVNLMLVLGIGALLHPVAVDRGTRRVDLPAMVAVTLLLVLLTLGGALDLLGGLVLLGAAAVYLVLVLRRGGEGGEEDAGSAPPGSTPVQALLLVVSLALVVVGADLLVDGAVEIAQGLGVSDAVIGLTVVAVGTSAPELVTMVVSTLRGATGLAVGNIVGSSVLNIALILGVTVLAAPGTTIGFPAEVVGGDLVLLAVATVATALAARSGSRVSRLEGAALVVGYLAYLTWLLVTRF